MTFAYYDHHNGLSEVVVMRERHNRIVVETNNTLTDDQMGDLYWMVLLMEKYGYRLKDLWYHREEYENARHENRD